MRILIGSISYPPSVSGVAISTHLLAQHLAAAGHEVTIVTAGSHFYDTVETDPKTGITVHRLRALPNPLRKGFFLPVLPEASVTQIMDVVQPDVVHLQDPMRTNYCLCLEARQRHIPVLATNHFTLDYILAYFPRVLRPLIRPIERGRLADFYNLCDRVTCPTQTVAALLHQMGVARPITALSNGVNIHRFYSYVSLSELRAHYHLPHHLPVVLYLGRIDREKSLSTLVQAIPEVLAQQPVHFVFAGGGSTVRKLRREIKKAGVQGSVSVTGAIPHNSQLLVAMYQAADIFVMPSIMETQSISTMEAMAAGKPIVAANSGALPELVHHEKNGLLFAPGNSTALASALNRLVQDPALREAMSKHSLEYVAEHELHTALGLYEAVYRDLCTLSHPAYETLPTPY